MQNRDHSAEGEVCHCLGDPVRGSVTSPAGLRGPGDSPAGWFPEGPARWSPISVQIWGQYEADMGADMGPSQAGDLGSASPCYSQICSPVVVVVVVFLIAAKPHCRG